MTKFKSVIIAPALAFLLTTSLNAEQFSITNLSLKQAIEEISKKSNMPYMVDGKLLEGKKAPNINNIEGVENALNEILKGSGLEATIENNTILISPTQGAIKVINGTYILDDVSVRSGKSGSAENGYVAKEVKNVGPWGEKSLQDTPYSMTVMPQELIENSISGDMDQIYKMNPIIQNSTPTSVYGTPYAAFRGFHSQSGIMDGLRLSSISNGIAMEELERVEIINGLTGFMYGVSAGEGIGGTTNYVLKRPTYQRLTNITLGNYGKEQWFGHLDLGNKIDEKGKFAYRLNVSHQDGETAKKNQNVERTLISGALDWNVTDNFQLQLEAAHTYYKIEGIDSLFYTNGGTGEWIKPLKNNKTYTPDWTYRETKTDRFGLNANWNINDIFTFRSAYMYKKDRQEALGSYPTYYFDDSTFSTGAISKEAPSWNIAQGAYAYLDSEFNTGSVKHKLTVGASGDILDVKRYQNNTQWVTGSPRFTNPNDLMSWSKPSILNDAWDYGKKYKSSKSTNSNIILGDDITFNEHFSALVGLNYTTVETENFNLSGDTTSKYDKSELTPTISLIFKPFEELTTYVTYMEGLTKGSTVPDNAALYNEPGKILDPFVSKQYEVGAKYAISESLLLSSALFRIEKANTYNEKGSNGKITISRDGKQIHQGLELLATGKITDNLTIMAGGTVMDVEVTKATDKAREGKEPTGVSSVLAKLYAEYNIPMVQGLTLTGGAYHSGSKYQDALNKNKIDGYTIYDAGLRYKTKIDKFPTTFNLNVANLTGKDYWATTWSSGIPRTVAFSMKMEF